jgi:hypothetical protein
MVQRGGCKYLDMCLEHSHLTDAPEEGECVAPTKSAQGSGVRERVSEGSLAYFGDLQL